MKKELLFGASVLALHALLVISFSGCGGSGSSSGGSGGSSTLSITVSSGTGTTSGSSSAEYTEGHINEIGEYDPSFGGAAEPGAGTLITLCSGVTITGYCSVMINIRTSDTTPGGYTIVGATNTNSYIMYMASGQYYDSIASKGTITLTSVGNVGQPITGTFDAVLGLRSIGTPTIGVSGTFSVIRDF